MVADKVRGGWAVLRANPRRVGFFLLTAVLQTVVDLTILKLMWGVVGVPLPVAATASWAGATLTGYTLNRLIVFKDGRATPGRRVGRYAVLVVANAVAAISLETVGVGIGLPYLLVRAFISSVLIVVNFYVMRGWVFQATDTEVGEDLAPVVAVPLVEEEKS